MSNRHDDRAREWAFFTEVIDPVVRDVLALDDAWEAYRRTNDLSGLLTDTSPGGSWDLPHSGTVYVAWAELTDLYETGRTPIPDAHAALRQAAARWLDRPAESTSDFIEQWVSEASQAVGAMYDRDGNWWREPG